MDYQSFHQPQLNQRRSQKMENASFILGIISIATACLVYTTLICGSLSILFALLSRGGEHTFAPKAKTGLILGCISLALILLLMVYTIVYANVYYGGLEDMMRQMYTTMGLDYDALLRSYY